MYYVKLVSPDGDVWQAVGDAANPQEIRKEVRDALDFDPGPRLSIEKLSSDSSVLPRDFTRTDVSRDEFLSRLTRSY